MPSPFYFILSYFILFLSFNNLQYLSFYLKKKQQIWYRETGEEEEKNLRLMVKLKKEKLKISILMYLKYNRVNFNFRFVHKTFSPILFIGTFLKPDQ